MAEYIVSLQLLLLALRAYIGIQTRLVQCICAARRDYYGRRLRSRRKVVLRLMARRRSAVVWADPRSQPWSDTVIPDFSSLQVMVDDTLSQSSTDPELSAIDKLAADTELLPPLDCSSSIPSCSSGVQSSASSSQQARWRKRKRDNNVELLQYLERADERFLQYSKDMNDTLLQKMEADTSALLGLMGRMVAVIEAQSHK